MAALPKYSRRAAPPKLVALSNALLAVADPQGPPEPSRDPARFGAWVENACLASAWNAGQQVAYWREEPFEVDAVIEGDWGRWAVEIKTGPVTPAELRGLLEFTRRTPAYRPLLVGEGTALAVGERLGIQTTDWRDFLVSGPPDAGVAR